MIIDFHTHFFPDEIAARATAKLEKAHSKIFGDGTLNSLREKMKASGVNLSLNLPVATLKEQVESINDRMIALQTENSEVITFGAMHPKYHEIASVQKELRRLSLNGIRGVKFHAEYQDFYPDDPKMLPYYEACRQEGLILLFHAGKDPAYREVKSHPKRLAQVAQIPNLKIVLAHMGGYQMWHEVEKYLMGLSRLYFDTAMCHEMGNVLFKEIIFGHGPYKILFGSDFPWSDPAQEIAKIKSLDLGQNFEEMIFSKNARWLLDI